MPIYDDIYDGPPNGYTDRKTTKRYVVIHSTQNTASAAGEASYAKRRKDDVSSHYYADEEEVKQSLDTDLGAWHVGSDEGNDGGVSWEFCGYAEWSRQEWLDNIAWPLAAAGIARDCAHHDIPVRDLSVGQIRDGKDGLITHDESRRVWGGTTHTDPGPNFPMDHLIALVKGEDGATEDKPGGTGKRPAPGPALDYPLPSGHYFGPAEWGDRSVSGHYKRRFGGRYDYEWLREWVEQLQRRGWNARKGGTYLTRYGSDGRYGDEHAELIRAFQRDQGLAVDGLLGPVTWRAAYRNPVT